MYIRVSMSVVRADSRPLWRLDRSGAIPVKHRSSRCSHLCSFLFTRLSELELDSLSGQRREKCSTESQGKKNGGQERGARTQFITDAVPSGSALSSPRVSSMNKVELGSTRCNQDCDKVPQEFSTCSQQFVRSLPFVLADGI